MLAGGMPMSPSSDQFDQLCEEFESHWSTDQMPSIVEFVQRARAINGGVGVVKLAVLDLENRWRSAGRCSTVEPRGFDDDELSLRPIADEYVKLFEELADSRRDITKAEIRARVQFGSSHDLAEFAKRFPTEMRYVAEVFAQEFGQLEPLVDDDLPREIGQYLLLKQLGMGGQARVYLGFDMDLCRHVAIKVPRPERIQGSSSFLDEARRLASLRHPGIVTVFSAGRINDVVYVVMEFVTPRTLRDELASKRRYDDLEAIELLAQVADAMHHAHTRNVFHRDLKPANIMLDGDGNPRVTDFGLALTTAEQWSHVGQIAGTPYYMSPEQVRGESHRLDGRTDIWSLGVILYEMMSGQRPFQGDTTSQVFDEIQNREVRPLSQFDHFVPVELDRICRRCLARQVSQRYASARELAEDLRSLAVQSGAVQEQTVEFNREPCDTQPTAPTSPDSDHPNAAVIPKGLRSFEEHDAGFFLQLLPGPTDPLGLPDCIRFWKTRIETNKSNRTFPVGVLYGPSGSGKSSLVKAGLLPNLSDEVVSIYIDSALGTEAILRKGLQKVCLGDSNDLDLIRLVAAIRNRQIPISGSKVLIVIDQFEQWLSANHPDTNTELVRALRHCDGVNIQCLILVRGDFFISLNRFMRELDIRLVDGQNTDVADLFSPGHAHEVLLKFGQAYKRFPQNVDDLNEEQQRFLDAATESLAAEGKIAPVRLSLFADMLKDKPWTPQTLTKSGGAEGVTRAFLEDKFESRSASAKYRRHRKAVQQLLEAMLPEDKSDIRGKAVAVDDLRSACGYQQNEDDFRELLVILDNELRFITPTNPEELETSSDDPGDVTFYQLTHDFLVPSIRDWLAFEDVKTRRGRAKALLGDRARQWHRTKEKRLLLSWSEYAYVLMFADRSRRTQLQREMLRQTLRLRLTQGLFACTSVILIAMLVLVGASRIRSFNDARRAEIVTNVEAPIGDRVQAFEMMSDEGLRVHAAEILPMVKQGSGLKLAPAYSDRMANMPDLKKQFEANLVDVVEDAKRETNDRVSAVSMISTDGLQEHSKILLPVMRKTDAPELVGESREALFKALQGDPQLLDFLVHLLRRSGDASWDDVSARSVPMFATICDDDSLAHVLESEKLGESTIRALVENVDKKEFLERAITNSNAEDRPHDSDAWDRAGITSVSKYVESLDQKEHFLGFIEKQKTKPFGEHTLSAIVTGIESIDLFGPGANNSSAEFAEGVRNLLALAGNATSNQQIRIVALKKLHEPRTSDLVDSLIGISDKDATTSREDWTREFRDYLDILKESDELPARLDDVAARVEGHIEANCRNLDDERSEEELRTWAAVMDVVLSYEEDVGQLTASSSSRRTETLRSLYHATREMVEGEYPFDPDLVAGTFRLFAKLNLACGQDDVQPIDHIRDIVQRGKVDDTKVDNTVLSGAVFALATLRDHESIPLIIGVTADPERSLVVQSYSLEQLAAFGEHDAVYDRFRELVLADLNVGADEKMCHAAIRATGAFLKDLDVRNELSDKADELRKRYAQLLRERMASKDLPTAIADELLTQMRPVAKAEDGDLWCEMLVRDSNLWTNVTVTFHSTLNRLNDTQRERLLLAFLRESRQADLMSLVITSHNLLLDDVLPDDYGNDLRRVLARIANDSKYDEQVRGAAVRIGIDLQ